MNIFKFLNVCWKNDVNKMKFYYYKSVELYENIQFYRLRSKNNLIMIFIEIRSKMEKQKIFNKADIINDNKGKYIWSVIIKKKN